VGDSNWKPSLKPVSSKIQALKGRKGTNDFLKPLVAFLPFQCCHANFGIIRLKNIFFLIILKKRIHFT
jgi:hypothetical protein